jgi:protease-4
VWTGKQAKELGLVDELGGLERALAIAKQQARIAQDTEVQIVVYPPRKSIYDLVSNPFGRTEGASTLASLLGFKDPRALETLTAPIRVFRRGEPLALMPNVFVR